MGTIIKCIYLLGWNIHKYTIIVYIYIHYSQKTPPKWLPETQGGQMRSNIKKSTDCKLLVLTGPLLNAHLKLTFASPMQASKNDAAGKKLTSTVTTLVF